MKRSFVFLLLCAYAGLVSAGNWSIGGGFLYSDNAYRDTKANRLVIPFVSYQHRYFVIYGPYAKVRYPINKQHTVGLTFQFGLNDYDPSDSSNPMMRQLNKRERLFYIGPYYRYRTKIGDFIGSVSTDITDRSRGGWMGHVRYSVTLAEPTLKYFVRPSIGLKWQNRKLNRHFYEVTPAEAMVSGFSAYQPKQTVAPFVNIFASVRLVDRIYWSNAINLSYLANQITRSPMSSGQRVRYSIITGLTYEIGQKEQRFNH